MDIDGIHFNIGLQSCFAKIQVFPSVGLKGKENKTAKNFINNLPHG